MDITTCLAAKNSEQDPFLLTKKCGSNNAAIRVTRILLMPQLALCWSDISQNKVAISQNLVGVLDPCLKRRERNFHSKSEAQQVETFLPQWHLSTLHLSLTRALHQSVWPLLHQLSQAPRWAVCLGDLRCAQLPLACPPLTDVSGLQGFYTPSLCSAASYRLKPSALPKTLC